MFRSTVFAVCLLALALNGCKSEDPPAGEEATTPTSNETKVAPETSPVGVVSEGPSSAVAVMVPVGESGASGVINLKRDGEVIHVTGEITGLTPGKHAFHVHEFGDVCNTEDGSSAGGHFNPEGHEHGRPSDENRHVGDLGNIEANEDGVAVVDIEDSVISLSGSHSVLGRTIVIHAGEDQFTQPSGDAGARVAIGVIGLSNSGE